MTTAKNGGAGGGPPSTAIQPPTDSNSPTCRKRCVLGVLHSGHNRASMFAALSLVVRPSFFGSSPFVIFWDLGDPFLWDRYSIVRV